MLSVENVISVTFRGGYELISEASLYMEKIAEKNRIAIKYPFVEIYHVPAGRNKEMVTELQYSI